MKLKRILFRVGSGLVGLVVIAAFTYGYVVWTEDPFGWKSPRDQEMIDNFHAHRGAFESLRVLAEQDGEWYLSEDTLEKSKLNDSQRAECRCLLHEVWSGMSVGFDYDHTARFIFASGGVGLAIGPGWAKGVTYIPGDATHYGVISTDLDKLTKAPDNVYLRELEPHWFLFYQRDDYDSPKVN